MCDLEFVQLLRGYDNPDNGYMRQLEELLVANPLDFLGKCTQILLADGLEIMVVTRATILMARILSPRGLFMQEQTRQIWGSLADEHKVAVQQALIRGIMFDSEELRANASHLLAVIAKIQFPVEVFNLLIQILQNSEKNMPAYVMVSALSTLKEIYQTKCISMRAHRDHWGYLETTTLTACFTIFAAEGIPEPFLVEASQLLLAALRTFPRVLNDPGFRGNVYEACARVWDCDDSVLHEALYHILLYMIFTIYDELTGDDMRVIFEIVNRDLSRQNMDSLFDFAQFWRSIAEFEDMRSRYSTTELQNITETTADTLIPVFLRMLSVIEEQEEGDLCDTGYMESLSREAKQTLIAFAKRCPEAVYQGVVAFFKEAVSHTTEWKDIFAASSSLLCIVDINQPEVHAFLKSTLEVLCRMTVTGSYRVREASIITIGTVLRYVSMEDAEEATILMQVIPVVIRQDIRTAYYTYSALHTYCLKFETNPNHGEAVEAALAEITSLVSSIIMSCDENCPPELSTATLSILMCSLSLENKLRIFSNLMTSLCNDATPIHIQKELLAVAVHVMYKKDIPDEVVEQCWIGFIHLLQTRADWLCEDTIHALGACVGASDAVGLAHANDLLGIVTEGLRSGDLTRRDASTVVMGELVRAQFQSIAEQALPMLEMLLMTVDTCESQTYLVTVITVISDILENVASQNPDVLLPYRDKLVMIVLQLSQTQYDQYDEDSVANARKMYESVLLLLPGVILAYGQDTMFLDKYKRKLFRIFEWKLLNVTVMHKKGTLRAIISFLERLLEVNRNDRPKKIRSESLTCVLVNPEISKYLEYTKNVYRNDSLGQRAKRCQYSIERLTCQYVPVRSARE